MNDDQLNKTTMGGCLLIAGIFGLWIFGPGVLSNPSTPVVSTKPAPVAEQRKSFAALNIELTELFAQCDDADAPIDDAMRKSDIYGAYDAASAALATCNDVSDKIGKLAVPKGIPEQVRSKLRTALDDCAAAYMARSASYDGARHVLNGDTSPETVEVAKDQKTVANEDAAKCAFEYMKAANSGGFSDIALSEVK
jgi:hypothetical protein